MSVVPDIVGNGVSYQILWNVITQNLEEKPGKRNQGKGTSFEALKGGKNLS